MQLELKLVIEFIMVEVGVQQKLNTSLKVYLKLVVTLSVAKCVNLKSIKVKLQVKLVVEHSDEVRVQLS